MAKTYTDDGDVIFSTTPGTFTVADPHIDTSTLTINSTDSSWATISPWATNTTFDNDVEIKGDLRLNGKSISEILERIETILKIPPELQEDPERLEMHAKLKELYDEYQEMSEKLKTWERLAGTRKD